MKFLRPITEGEIGKFSTRVQKRYGKKRAHKVYRSRVKEAIRSGYYELVPRWGKFRGWED